MIVAEYAPATAVRERNIHIFPVLYSAVELDYMIYGLNDHNRYHEASVLQKSYKKLMVEFDKFLSIKVVVWKEMYALDKGKAQLT